ncbi:MAG: gluconate 2-dehydrogenase subunit 3 family protein [Maribacter sp.]|nr:gluconate 2-dehydrogenase subunit 3 family protein [Maribacter sp.]
MDRRKAIKNMGLSLGYVVTTPTLISIVQSCKAENALKWTPDFFTKDEGTVITHLVDLILPKSDTPSASEVQVDIFIDRFIDQVMQRKDQQLLKFGMRKFIGKALADTGKKSAGDLKRDEIEAVLSTAIKIPMEAQKANDKAIENYMEALTESTNVRLDDEVAQYAFAKEIRAMTIFGYKSSEFVGKEVMKYLPVPGAYVACGTTEELTGGKAWSL